MVESRPFIHLPEVLIVFNKTPEELIELSKALKDTKIFIFPFIHSTTVEDMYDYSSLIGNNLCDRVLNPFYLPMRDQDTDEILSERVLSIVKAYLYRPIKRQHWNFKEISNEE